MNGEQVFVFTGLWTYQVFLFVLIAVVFRLIGIKSGNLVSIGAASAAGPLVGTAIIAAWLHGGREWIVMLSAVVGIVFFLLIAYGSVLSDKENWPWKR